ncbi:sulfite exporter TauE/SafE family protein [Vibrio aestuarianus]|uniref:Probable membrane transporter protein n=1 Tax=Vibrio aestuarianus TaxID=28171 RepID=A0A9X4IZ73_9VIBR|nr:MULTISPECIES: sulfite exporter TauE/SafE family protein [Vibrio]MDE1233932.1 sulfite exporter TauE/SafE family protein [Vibrio aestuarianus]MDE1244809.1 sulfite exporter TauE/SafE family protein [Vibrio aestuarianus]MDE1333183.1 sulfite exporter TauE/SafE family protein [Vibrio aestuarianus]MDE1345384.1 sulfite exporter TauE/SafE family protein [Vibrio aestuarianus]MDE1356148.1 sulfite exporter TauE/SafE family protein [Vibrio aestuarianus]
MNFELLSLLLLLGSVVGFMAGLLGIGGGLIVVPALLFLLPIAGIAPELSMHLALATSLATIIVTSGSSALNHLKLGNVDMFVVKWLMPGVIVGGFLGSIVAELIPTQYLPKVFGVIVFFLAIQMFLSIKATTSRSMPNAWVTMLCGGGIGVVSSLAGIGGGSLSVPFLNRHGVEMRKAVGSSSVCGCVIAISGMIGFILHGYQVENLPQYSLGYVYLPALVAIASTSIFTTRIGARYASQLPTVVLKKIFSIFLMCIAVTMLL